MRDVPERDPIDGEGAHMKYKFGEDRITGNKGICKTDPDGNLPTRQVGTSRITMRRSYRLLKFVRLCRY